MAIPASQMHELSLFSGAGGGLLATKWLLGFRTICYVENNPYRVGVLKARIRDGLLDDAPIWDDARTFDGRPWRGSVDIVTAGFPCQPFSVAGKRRGADDERNLWPDTVRIIREVRPEWCLLENVPGLLSGSHGYFGQILRGLAESGYDARWKVLSAAEVGASHKRDRIWIMAHAHSERSPQPELWGTSCRKEGNAVLTVESLLLAFGPPGPSEISRIPRMADGLAHRVDRLKAIGEGQVSAVVRAAWKLLTGDTSHDDSS